MGSYHGLVCASCHYAVTTGPGPMPNWGTRTVICPVHRELVEVLSYRTLWYHFDHSELVARRQELVARGQQVEVVPEEILATEHGVSADQLKEEWARCCTRGVAICDLCGESSHPLWFPTKPCPRCSTSMLRGRVGFRCPQCGHGVQDYAESTRDRWGAVAPCVCATFRAIVELPVERSFLYHCRHSPLVLETLRSIKDDRIDKLRYRGFRTLMELGLEERDLEEEKATCGECLKDLLACPLCGRTDHPSWSSEDGPCPKCGATLQPDGSEIKHVD